MLDTVIATMSILLRYIICMYILVILSYYFHEGKKAFRCQLNLEKCTYTTVFLYQRYLKTISFQIHVQ